MTLPEQAALIQTLKSAIGMTKQAVCKLETALRQVEVLFVYDSDPPNVVEKPDQNDK